MHDFKKKSDIFYDYEHDNLILSVLVSEAFNVAMSGEYDETLVLHDLASGKIINKIAMKYGDLKCLFDLGSAVAVRDFNTVRFLDLQTNQIQDRYEVKTKGDKIVCMGLSISQSQSNEMLLLVGGQNSNSIDKITALKTIV